MVLSRRGLLGMLAAGVGAAIVRPGLIMPIKPVGFLTLDQWARMAELRVNPPLWVDQAFDTALPFDLTPGAVNITFRMPIPADVWRKFNMSATELVNPL